MIKYVGKYFLQSGYDGCHFVAEGEIRKVGFFTIFSTGPIKVVVVFHRIFGTDGLSL